MSYWSAIFLGLVQGVSEFLPISSSGHLALFQNFFNLTNTEDGHLFFEVLLHLGTLFAVLIAYRKDILELIVEFGYMTHFTKLPRGKKANIPARRMIIMLILATLPLVLVLPVKDFVEGLYNNTFFVGFALIATGLILFGSDRIAKGSKDAKNATMWDALLVGCGQCLAVVPGISRSGTSISAGLLCGFDREYAVKFSFILSIPAILGANILSFADALEVGVDSSLIPVYAVGVLTAMVSGYASIYLLRFIAKKGKFGTFAYYCWAIGLVTLILSLVA